MCLCVCVSSFSFFSCFLFSSALRWPFYAALLAGLNVDLLFAKLFLNSLASSFAAHVCVCVCSV